MVAEILRIVVIAEYKRHGIAEIVLKVAFSTIILIGELNMPICFIKINPNVLHCCTCHALYNKTPWMTTTLIQNDYNISIVQRNVRTGDNAWKMSL